MAWQVPLAFMDLFKFYPALKNAMPLTNENVRTSPDPTPTPTPTPTPKPEPEPEPDPNQVRTAFVVIFIPIRIVYWPYVCSEFWQGALCWGWGWGWGEGEGEGKAHLAVRVLAGCAVRRAQS